MRKINSELVSGFIKIDLKHGADLCFIHFSARNSKPGKFNEYPTPVGSSNIYLNPCNKGWYVNGLPCFGDSFEQTLEILRELIDVSGAQHVVCIGSSMGAFGAALFSCHLGADVICFAPELYLNIYSGFSNGDNLVGRLPRLDNLDSPGKALIFAGLNSPSDVICAEFFKSFWPNCNSFLFKNCGHGTASHLKKAGLLDRVIRCFVEDIEIEPLIKSLLVMRSEMFTNDLIGPGGFLESHLDSYIDAVYEKIRLFDLMEICSHLRSRGAFGPAFRFSERLIVDYGPLPELLLLKAQCLRRMRLDVDAINVFSSLQENQYYRNQAMLGLGLVYKRLGKTQSMCDSYVKLVAGVKKDLELYSSLLSEAQKDISIDDLSFDVSSLAIPTGVKRVENFPQMDCKLSSGRSESDYVNCISASIKIGDFEQASRLAIDGLNDIPGSKLIQSEFAHVSLHSKDWLATIDRLLTLAAMEEDSPSATTYSRLIQAYRNAKQFDSADAIATEGLTFFPGDVTIQSEFSWNAEVQKNWPVAVERLEVLFTLHGSMNATEKMYIRLAQAYRGMGRVESSDNLLRQGLVKFPGSIKINNIFENGL
jgi:tetratricopeptide (TPR) repeat protein